MESSRRTPEKQRASLASRNTPVVRVDREIEEPEGQITARAARIMAASVGVSGSPSGATAESLRVLARRVGNRRLTRWVAQRQSPQSPTTEALPETVTDGDGVSLIRRDWKDEEQKQTGSLSSTLRPNPFDDTAGPAGGQPAAAGLTPSGLMPNPFPETKATGATTEGEQQATSLTPSGLRPNPFPETKAAGATTEAEQQATAPLTPSGLRPNPFPETKAAGATTEAEQQAMAPLTPSGLRPNPFPETKATGFTTETEVQATVGELQAEDTALGGTSRQAEVSTEAPQPSDQASTLASEGRGQTAAVDETSREEAAAAETSAREGTAPETAPASGGTETLGVEPGALDAAPLDEAALGPQAERALARARQWIESVVSRMIGMLNPVGAVLSALNAIHNVITEMARSVSRVVTPVWQAVSGAIQSVVSFVTRQASSLLASARAEAQRVVQVVTSTLGGAADAVMERIRALRRQAYARVVQMVQSARLQGIARLTGLVTSLIERIRATGQQIRAGIQAAVAAVVAAIAAARNAARGELDRLLGGGRQVGAVRARLRAWARARLRGLAQTVMTGRTATVSTVRTALFAVVGHIGLLWQAAQSAFSETFAAPLAQAREHVPELLGQIEMGFAEAEGQVAQPGPVAELELALVERELDTAAAQISAEAEETGSTL